MDLGAYVQIPDLESIAKRNNIKVSRLRGYRLMKDEKPISITEEYISYIKKDCVERLIYAIPKFSLHPTVISYSLSDSKLLFKYYDTTNNEIKWNNIHGKFRKHLKYLLKKTLSLYNKQNNMFNKYIGREDVLYIHARLGSRNWSDITYKYYEKEPWYLDGIDDVYDRSYCDIYAKIE